MNCLIVDNEFPALALLKNNISQVPYLELVGEARNLFDVINLLSDHEVDLIFFNIQTPEFTKLEFLKSFRNPPLVILISVCERDSIQAYNYVVIDRLLNPVQFINFIDAVGMAYAIYRNTITHETDLISADHLFVNANYSLVRVMIREIALIEGMKDYVQLYLTSDKVIATRLSLKLIEQRLGSTRFMRIHKSYIIAFDKIDAIKKTELLIHGKEVPIGDGYRKQLQIPQREMFIKYPAAANHAP